MATQLFNFANSKIVVLDNPTNLIGSYLVIDHNLNQKDVDVTVFDDEGVVGLEYMPLTAHIIQVDFDGLLPFTKTYTVLIQK